MRQEAHPYSGMTYQQVEDGRVRVTEGDKYGLFTWKGEYIEGDITQADINMLRYVGGPDLPADHDIFWSVAPAATHDGSIPVRAYPGTHMDDLPRTQGKYKPDPGMETAEGVRSTGYLDMDFLLKNDRRPDLLPKSFHMRNPVPGGAEKLDVGRYYKKEFHDLEVEKLWKKTWQMACREDNIPNVGDFEVYEIASLSYLVVRTKPDEIRAFQNICLHRGRLLKDCSGKKAKDFRCPYHGWVWRIDGTLKDLPTEWDFPGVRKDVAQLPEIKVARWAGFVFVNPDPDAGSFEEFLGPVAIDYYKKYKLENRYVQCHVQRIAPANWKLAMEAFMESHHLGATHPQYVNIGGDLANQRFDVFGNWGRGNHLGTYGSPQRDMFVSPEEALAIYRATADGQKALLRDMIGDEVEQFSDAELNDTGGFHDLFPNLHPWGGWARIVFRFRPNGDNPEESIMDVWLLAPWPEGKPKPPPAKLRKLRADESWTLASEMFSLSKILEQDMANLAGVQAGLKAKQPPYVWLSMYQESKIRNFHRNYDRVLGISAE